MDAEKSLVAIVDNDPSVCRVLARFVRSLRFQAPCPREHAGVTVEV